jgi:hypothetical protein
MVSYKDQSDSKIMKHNHCWIDAGKGRVHQSLPVTITHLVLIEANISINSAMNWQNVWSQG